MYTVRFVMIIFRYARFLCSLGQVYDGADAAVGKLDNVQKLIEDLVLGAVYGHYSIHSLGLALAYSCTNKNVLWNSE